MKVLYIYNPNSALPGVNNKIVSKIKDLKKKGLDITVLCKTNETYHPELAEFRVIYARKNKPLKLGRLFNLKYLNFITQIFNDKSLNDYYERELSKIDFDLLIMRYSNSNFQFNRLVKKYKNKFIFEHNTIELEQLKLKYKNIFKSHSWISYIYLSEKYYGPRTLSNAAGIIGVTNEITNYEMSRVRENLLPISTTISNGINVDSYPLNSPENFEREFNMVMILGVNAEWHGLNRIINGLNNFAKDINVKLYVIGKVNEIECSKVIYKGHMNFEEMNSFFENHSIHVGIASLALHRINIREASVLKAREYMARGIPFVYGYIDTDIEGNKLIEQFCFKVSADESPVDINSIVNFYKSVSLINNYPQAIRDFAKQKVDMSVKMQQYVDFLRDIEIKKTQGVLLE